MNAKTPQFRPMNRFQRQEIAKLNGTNLVDFWLTATACLSRLADELGFTATQAEYISPGWGGREVTALLDDGTNIRVIPRIGMLRADALVIMEHGTNQRIISAQALVDVKAAVMEYRRLIGAAAPVAA